MAWLERVGVVPTYSSQSNSPPAGQPPPFQPEPLPVGPDVRQVGAAVFDVVSGTDGVKPESSSEATVTGSREPSPATAPEAARADRCTNSDDWEK